MAGSPSVVLNTPMTAAAPAFSPPPPHTTTATTTAESRGPTTSVEALKVQITPL